MKTAIIGFAGSGKTDLFAALAGEQAVPVGRAMVKVPEERLAPLAEYYESKKIVPAEIEYLDIPGGGRTSSLGERVMNDIRPYDCLLALLDAFSGVNEPENQRQALETDLLVADLAVVEKRLERIAMDKRKAKDLVDPKEEQMLERAKAVLESERALREEPEVAEAPELRGFGLLSSKPVLWAWNVSEADLSSFNPPETGSGTASVVVSAKLERDLAEIEDPEELEMFMADLEVAERALDRVIRATFDLLGLITFLTGGEKEARAWPLRAGSSAPEAAGVIHSDIQKGFIRAQVLAWKDFTECGGFKQAKEKGLVRKEGKEYVVKDGDIIEFFFNV